MRIFTACFAHESSAFSPIPTSIENFREGLLHRPSRGELVPIRLQAIECALTAKATERGYDVVESIGAAATPSGPTIRADFEALRDELLSDLRKAMPVDAVALFLHGAQLAEGYDDCEGEILRAVREIVGPEVPIGAEIDLHGNITEAMMAHATLIIACKEYPHTDFLERADELLDILEATVAGDTKPTAAYCKLPMMGLFHTTREPMRGLVDRLMEMEKEAGILSLSIAHGFFFADTPHVGAAVIAVTDNDMPRAEALCREIGSEFFALRDQVAAPTTSVADAFDEAAAHEDGLTIIADTADNAGGGAGSDSTHLLRELIDRKTENAALGMIWDPVAVDFAFTAGVGANLPLRIGGKVGRYSGDPVDAEVTVTALNPALSQISFGYEQPLGRAAAVRLHGIDVVLSAAREQTHSPECFTGLGINPTTKRLLVLKSAQHFHAKFSPLADRIIYAVAPGVTSLDLTTFTYKNVPRPIWPLDPEATFAG